MSFGLGSITIYGGDINFTGTGLGSAYYAGAGIELASIIIQASNNGATPSNVNITGVYDASTQGAIADGILFYNSIPVHQWTRLIL